jgi:proteasome lid subunit RPN8/RPN11
MSADVLIIPQDCLRRVEQHLSACMPEEGCGLLAGRDAQVSQVYTLRNVLHSAVRYRMDPQELFDSLQAIENIDLELLAIFHSHPNGPDNPSATDIAEAYYPEAAMLILSHQGGSWRCKGFRVVGGMASEIRINIIPEM